MRWMQAFLIGVLPTVFIIGASYAPGPDPLATLFNGLLISLCPIVWVVAIPGAFIIGFIVLGVIRLVRGGGRYTLNTLRDETAANVKSGLEATRAMGSRKKALDDFVAEAVRRGEPRHRIAELLQRNGWPSDEVNAALGRAAASTP